MAIAFVQQKTGNGAGTTTASITLTSAPTNGNALFLMIVDRTTGGAASTISSISQTGATWSRQSGPSSPDNTTGSACEIWAALNVSGAGTGITITFGANSYAAVVVAEFSGVATSGALDQQLANGGAAANSTQTSPSISTTWAVEVVLAACGTKLTGQTSLFSGPTSSFTAFTQPAGQATLDLYAAYRIVAATGTYSTSWTFNQSPDANTIIASFTEPKPPQTSRTALFDVVRQAVNRAASF